jgi:hypothetical protein
MFFGLNDVGFLGSLQPPLTLLLDLYPNAAAAYSLRQLRTGVTNVVRVRRSSDNTETDFTATQVSDGALAAWVGAGNNGFVSTWYDQSGNGRHLAQATTASQPAIVSSGSLQVLSGKPALLFDGTDHFLGLSFSRNIRSVFAVCNYTKSTTVFSEFDGLFTGTDMTGEQGGIGLIGGGAGTNFLRFGSALSQYETMRFNDTVYVTGTSVFPRINTISLWSGFSADDATGNGVQIGKDRNQTVRHWGGFVPEIICYTANQISDAVAIESNINAHYAIY